MAVLECAGLSKSYGAVKALEDIDLKVEPGRVVRSRCRGAASWACWAPTAAARPH